MARTWVIFLDDGGVMNDNSVRGPQWQRMVAGFFAPILGGSEEDWIRANRLMLERMAEPAAWDARLRSASTYAAFDHDYMWDWLSGMCAMVGVVMPEPDVALHLARQINEEIPYRIRSAFPGAIEAIRTLHGQGHILHTASNESSIDLQGYLSGMGVRPYFSRLYGPDLIDIFKIGPEYYQRIFTDCDVDPDSAIVVDDNARILGWAASTGARTVLVGSGQGASGVTRVIASLSQLPDVLRRIAVE